MMPAIIAHIQPDIGGMLNYLRYVRSDFEPSRARERETHTQINS